MRTAVRVVAALLGALAVMVTACASDGTTTAASSSATAAADIADLQDLTLRVRTAVTPQGDVDVRSVGGATAEFTDGQIVLVDSVNATSSDIRPVSGGVRVVGDIAATAAGYAGDDPKITALMDVVHHLVRTGSTLSVRASATEVRIGSGGYALVCERRAGKPSRRPTEPPSSSTAT